MCEDVNICFIFLIYASRLHLTGRHVLMLLIWRFYLVYVIRVFYYLIKLNQQLL